MPPPPPWGPGRGGGMGGDTLGWGHPQKTIQSPDSLYKAPKHYTSPKTLYKAPETLYKDPKYIIRQNLCVVFWGFV